MRGKVKGSLDKVLSSGKYLMVVLSLGVLLFLDNPRWAIPIRVGNFFNSVKLTFEHADNVWIARTIIVISGFVLAIIIPAFWCRYLCPTGGILELFNKFSLFKYFMTSDCDDCGKCRKVCNLESRPLETNCTNCGDCDTMCPDDAIKLGCKIRQ